MKEKTITIPFPRPTQNVNRGFVHGRGRVTAPESQPTTIRFTNEARFKIDMVAAKLNMSFGEFVRWCADYAAIEVGNQLTAATFSIDGKPKAKIDTSGYE